MESCSWLFQLLYPNTWQSSSRKGVFALAPRLGYSLLCWESLSAAASHIAPQSGSRDVNALLSSHSHTAGVPWGSCLFPGSIFWKCSADVARGVSPSLIENAVKQRVKINYHFQYSGCNFIRNRIFTDLNNESQWCLWDRSWSWILVKRNVDTDTGWGWRELM